MIEEKELLERIRNSAEKIEIPESLTPEIVTKELILATSGREIRRWTEVAAIICILLIGGMAMKNGSLRSNMNNSKEAVSEESFVSVYSETELVQEEEIMSFDVNETQRIVLYESGIYCRVSVYDVSDPEIILTQETINGTFKTGLQQENGILFVVEKDENLILYRINYEKEQLSVVEMDMISKRTDDSDQNIRIDTSAPEKPLIQYDEVE